MVSIMFLVGFFLGVVFSLVGVSFWLVPKLEDARLLLGQARCVIVHLSKKSKK